MPLVGPTPLFHGHPIVVIFDPAIPLATARSILALIADEVQRLGATDARVDDLTTAVVGLVADHGFLAQVVARTRESVEFFVSPRPTPRRSTANDADDDADDSATTDEAVAG